MKTTTSRAIVVLIALGLFAPRGLAVEGALTSAEIRGIDQATARLAALDKDLDGLRGQIETARRFAPAAPSSITAGLDRARPRVREAVSLVFGLHWSRVEPVLGAAHAVEKKIADLEERVRTWPTSPAILGRSVESPTAAGAITGIVTDEVTGNPLPNVTVYVIGPDWQTGTATSDATGRWIVTGLATGTYRAYTPDVPAGYVKELFKNIPCVTSCSPSSGTPIAVTDGAVTSGVNFTLSKTGSISGHVTDVTSGLGVAQVRVWLYVSRYNNMQETLTGVDGSYSFPQVPAGTYFLTASHQDYLRQLYDGKPCDGSCDVSTGTPVVVTPSANTSDIDFALQAAGSVSGKVTSAATGVPITSGHVLLYDAAGQWESAYLDSSGSYRIGGLKAGTYFAKTDTYYYADQLYDGFLCEPSCGGTTGTPIVVTLGEERQGVNFSLATFGAFQGKVTDSATGFPLPNTSVSSYASSDGSLVSYDYADEFGSYVSGGLATGTYFSVASSTTHLDELYRNLLCEPSCDPTNGTPIPVTLGSTTGSIDFALDLGGGVSGTVTAAVSGVPLAYVAVEVFDATGVSAGSVHTNEQGLFVMGDLLPGTYFARANRSSNHLGQLFDGLPCDPSCTATSGTPITVTGGVVRQGINFVLSSLGAISGTVTDAGTGQPLSSVYVLVYDATGAYAGYGSTDFAGAFKVTGLSAGAHFARVALEGYVPQLYSGIPCADPCTVTTGTAIPVVMSAEVGGIDFPLVALGKISGTLTDAATGLPLSYRNVAVYDAAGTLVTYCYSDGTGTYTVSDLPSGNYFVSTTRNTDYVEELYDNLDCGDPCDVTRGTPVTVTLGTVRTVDFKLHKPYFADVGLSHWARPYIEGVYVAGVTSGCSSSPLSFCPDSTVSRWQLAVFVAPPMAGSDDNVPVSGTVPTVGDYNCVAGGVSLFPNDVPPADGGCRYIHYIYSKGLTSGCAPGSFCPGSQITRWQTAVFLAGALAGSDDAVPVSGTVSGVGVYNCVAGGTTLFPNDVPATDSGCRHIHYIYGRGLTGGCAPGSYCPGATLSRAQMAVFLATGFNFTKYGF